jgi:hypothetical protein
MNAPVVVAPFVVVDNLYQPQLQVSWPAQAGLSVDHYEVYVDGGSTPVATPATNLWMMTAADGLAAGSTHSFQIAYVTSTGGHSPLSPATSGKTWSGNNNWGGIPSDWMSEYYGVDMFTWPSPNASLEAGGPTLLHVFLSGGNPLDSSTWLRTKLVSTSQGPFLTWNSQPGLIYQVQASTNLTSWVDLGSPRLAADKVDSLLLSGSNFGYYRVVRLR